MEKRLKIIRKNNKLSQRDFAVKIGVSYVTLQSYEKDASAITVKMTKNIASIFGVDLVWLLTGEGDMNSSGRSENMESVVKLKPVVEKHIDVVKQFDDHEAAVDMNQDLVFIEKKSKTKFEKVRSYIKGMREGLEDDFEVGHKKKQLERRKNNTPFDHPERRKKAG